MDKKLLALGALVLGAALVLILLGSQTVARPPQAAAQSALVATEILYGFGEISMKNGNVEHTFEVTNPSDKTVTITSVSTSCMCTTAFLLDGEERLGPFGMPGHGGPSTSVRKNVPPGGTLRISVVYDPNAHGPAGVGTIDRFVYLKDESGRILPLEIQANVTP